MRKTVKYKNKNTTIVYSSGMTQSDVMDVIRERIKKRDAELQKREWIYKEYLSLLEKQKQDKDWLAHLEMYQIIGVENANTG